MIDSYPIPPLDDPAFRRALADKVMVARQIVPRRRSLATGWAAIDDGLPAGGLPHGMIHEWIGVASTPSPPVAPALQPRSSVYLAFSAWTPPLSILIHLARGACAASPGALILWIGSTVWPYGPALAPGADASSHVDSNSAAIPSSLLPASILLHAPDVPSRIWAADMALRSRAACVVIVDASTFDLSATRRLQLAAEGGDGLCLLARPPWEQRLLSASGTRWLVRSCPASTQTPNHTPAQRWAVELLRCKGMPPTPSASREWILEFSHATRHVAVVPDLRGRSGETQAGPPARCFA